MTVVGNELSRREGPLGPSKAGENLWLLEAKANYFNARCHYRENRYHAAWIELKAAQRSMIFDPQDDEGVASLATTLRHDALFLESGRRRSAMLALLGRESDSAADTKPTRADIAKAAELLDDHFDTQYHRIELRRRHLVMLFWGLFLFLATLVAFSYCRRIELFSGAGTASAQLRGTPDGLVAVILFGLLGASLSIAQTMAASSLTTKITSQRVVAFAVWMRPIIGATAAVVSYVLLLANAKLKIFNGEWGSDFNVVCIIAIVAGFSERFVTGALDRVAPSENARKG